MDLHHESTYAAEPHTVFAMLTDREFLDRRAVATKAVRHDVEVEAMGTDGGIRTRTLRALPVDVLPRAVRKFAGDSLEIDETIRWGPPAADGSRSGQVSAEVARVPVRMHGTVRLVPDGPGRSRQVVDAEIRASIPMVGRKIEEAAGSAVVAALQVEERLGRERLGG